MLRRRKFGLKAHPLFMVDQIISRILDPYKHTRLPASAPCNEQVIHPFPALASLMSCPPTTRAIWKLRVTSGLLERSCGGSVQEVKRGNRGGALAGVYDALVYIPPRKRYELLMDKRLVRASAVVNREFYDGGAGSYAFFYTLYSIPMLAGRISFTGENSMGVVSPASPRLKKLLSAIFSILDIVL